MIKILRAKQPCDSQLVMNAINPRDVPKIKSKFYGTKLPRIREGLECGNVDMSYNNTKENTADILMKPLTT